MSSNGELKAPGLATIDTASLAVLLRSGISMVVLDASPDSEDTEARIPGAKKLSADSSAYEVDRALGSRYTLAVTYCSNLQDPASMELYKHLKNLGYENVLEYSDGLAAWKAAGYPVEQEPEQELNRRI